MQINVCGEILFGNCRNFSYWMNRRPAGGDWCRNKIGCTRLFQRCHVSTWSFCNFRCWTRYVVQLQSAASWKRGPCPGRSPSIRPDRRIPHVSPSTCRRRRGRWTGAPRRPGRRRMKRAPTIDRLLICIFCWMICTKGRNPCRSRDGRLRSRDPPVGAGTFRTGWPSLIGSFRLDGEIWVLIWNFYGRVELCDWLVNGRDWTCKFI